MTVLTSKTFDASGKKPVEPCTVPIDPSAAHAEPVKVPIEQCGTHTEPCGSIPTSTYQPKSFPTKQTILLLSVIAILTMALFPVVVIRLAYMTRIFDGLHTSHRLDTTSTGTLTTVNGLTDRLNGLDNDSPDAQLSRIIDSNQPNVALNPNTLATATSLSHAASLAETSASNGAAEGQIRTSRQPLDPTAEVALAFDSDGKHPTNVLLKRLLPASTK